MEDGQERTEEIPHDWKLNDRYRTKYVAPDDKLYILEGHFDNVTNEIQLKLKVCLFFTLQRLHSITI